MALAKLNPSQRLDIIEPKVKEHDDILIRGNGELSVLEQLRNIMEFIKTQKEEKKEHDDNQKYWTRLIASLAITNIVSLVFAIIIWFVRIWPLLEKISIETVSR